jgi:integral membrane protein (TIGR01906 family)
MADTGMSVEDLTEAGRALIDYLTGKSHSPQIVTTIHGEERPLYNKKELLHLEDVRNLFRTGLTAEWIATAAALALTVLLLAARKHKAASIAFYAAAISTIAILVLLALPAASDFTGWWTKFHLITFTNDLWLLDPQTDWLIRMFPEPFFSSKWPRGPASTPPLPLLCWLSQDSQSVSEAGTDRERPARRRIRTCTRISMLRAALVCRQECYRKPKSPRDHTVRKLCSKS